MIAYRATMYAPKSVDPTETTVITPRPGAAHSDAFKVATVTGVSGFQPYLNRVIGRAGGIDPLTKAVNTGTLRLEIGDIRVAADTSDLGLQRWFTAFAGDASNRWQTPACKVKVEIARDWDPVTNTTAAGWSTYFTGRAGVPSTESLLRRGLRLTDLSTDLEQPIFTEDPHPSITYAARARIWPVGVPIDWGDTAAQAPIEMEFATLFTLDPTGGGEPGFRTNGFEPSVARTITRNLINRLPGGRVPLDARFRARPQTGTNAGVTLTVPVDALAGEVGGGDAVLAFEFYAISTPAITTGAICDVWIDVPAGEPLSSAVPLLIGDVHPVTFLQDLLDGYFGQLNTTSGDPDFPVAYDASSFAALAGDTTLPSLRFVIAKREKSLKAFLVKEILEPCNLGYRIDETGQFVLVDLRPPTTMPAGADLVTLTDADLLAVPDRAQWDEGDQAVSRLVGTYYVDTVLSDADLRRQAYADVSPSRLASGERQHVYYSADARGLDVARQPHEFTAQGFRTTPDEDGGARETVLTQQIDRLGAAFDSPFGLVPMVASVRCKNGDGAPAQNATVGKYLSLDTPALENPETCERGGALLFRLIEVSDEGLGHLERRLTGLYLGPDPTAGVPLAPTALGVTSDTETTITLSVTMPATGLPDFLRAQADDGGGYVTWGADIARTAGASAAQSVVLSGFAPGTAYTIRFYGVSSSGVLSVSASPTVTETTDAPTTIPTPTLSGSKTGSVLSLTITPGPGTPTGVVWYVNRNGAYFDTTDAVDYEQLVPGGVANWTVYGILDGYDDSAVSNTISA